MKERPILFSAPMIRALLAGAKTQTRRALKVQPIGKPYSAQASLTKSGSRPVFYAGWDERAADGSTCCICPYGVPGDRLWVREAWATHACFDDLPPREIKGSFHYQADGEIQTGKGRPSIHMPRWASRILLEVTEVRVERLQDISRGDALAEGIVHLPRLEGYGLPDGSHFHATDPRISYWSLWDAINGPGSVESNPYVWAVSFKTVEGA